MKKKIKLYDKEYEDVFSGERTLKTIKWDNISNNIGLTNLQYIEQVQHF